MDMKSTRFVTWGWVMLIFVLTTGYPVSASAEQGEAPAEEIQERGVAPGLLGK